MAYRVMAVRPIHAKFARVPEPKMPQIFTAPNAAAKAAENKAIHAKAGGSGGYRSMRLPK